MDLRIPRPLFAFAILLNSFLLFTLQPFVGKLMLPYMGGTAATWAVVLLFFQGCLLAGYGVTYLLSRGGLISRVLFALYAVALAAGCFSPLYLPRELLELSDLSTHPLTGLLGILFRHFFLVSVVLSSGSTIIQRSAARLGERFKGDPYTLYAWSNVGSFAALLCYPLLIEPTADLMAQGQALQASYILNACLLLGIALLPGQVREVPAEDNASRFNLRWLLIPAATSGLLISFSVFLSTNIAPIPLLWIVPLFLFLLSYAAGFSGLFTMGGFRRALWGTGCLTLFLYLWILKAAIPFWMVTSAYLVTFAVLLTAAHSALFELRPPAAKMPLYYLTIAAGGFLGGVIVNFLCPIVFNDLFELPIFAIVAFLGAIHAPEYGKRLPAAMGIVAVFAVVLFGGFPGFIQVAPKTLLLATLVSLFILDFRASVVIPRISAVVLLVILNEAISADALLKLRNFYGTLTVVRSGEFHTLFHGVTVHGTQKVDTMQGCQPTSYYHPSGPAGSVLRAAAAVFPQGTIGLIGVGTGALACYLENEQKGVLFELNPDVIKVAHTSSAFTYLLNARSRNMTEKIGDARTELHTVSSGTIDILVIDAFHSDAVPVHLLTAEAFAEYQRVLSSRGVLVIHISNLYLDLQPVVEGAADSLGLHTWFWSDDSIHDGQKEDGKDVSSWALVGHSDNLEPFRNAGGWKEAAVAQPIRWTDQYSSIYSILNLR